MTLIAYADARDTIVTQLTTDLTDAKWTVYAAPPDSFDPPAIILATQESDRENLRTFKRDFIVGLFVRRDSIVAAYDLIDATVPALLASLDAVGHIVIGTVSRPEPVTWTDVHYIAVFVPVTIETTP